MSISRVSLRRMWKRKMCLRRMWRRRGLFYSGWQNFLRINPILFNVKPSEFGRYMDAESVIQIVWMPGYRCEGCGCGEYSSEGCGC